MDIWRPEIASEPYPVQRKKGSGITDAELNLIRYNGKRGSVITDADPEMFFLGFAFPNLCL